MPNPNPLEKDIEKKVCDYAKKLGCLCYKFTSPARRSVPDRLFIMPGGHVFFIEFKRLGCKPTSAQEIEIAKIRKQEVCVFVVDYVEKGMDAVNRAMTGLEGRVIQKLKFNFSDETGRFGMLTDPMF